MVHLPITNKHDSEERDIESELEGGVHLAGRGIVSCLVPVDNTLLVVAGIPEKSLLSAIIRLLFHTSNSNDVERCYQKRPFLTDMSQNSKILLSLTP